MTSLNLALVLSVTAASPFAIVTANVISATAKFVEKADPVVILRNVIANEYQVAGEILNMSSQPVRDVELQILYSWRWKDEFHPGTDRVDGVEETAASPHSLYAGKGLSKSWKRRA